VAGEDGNSIAKQGDSLVFTWDMENYGTSLCGSRGNIEVFLMLLRAQNSITTLSRPTPKPP